MPQMNEEGVRAVRLLHERCTMGSVRDPLTLEFLQRHGIHNAELTGCPVLFHALREPAFETTASGRLCLSVRARLLHVDQKWVEKELCTLETLCHEFKPLLVLQSPYDLPLAEPLIARLGLDHVHDEDYGHEEMLRAAMAASRTVGFRLHFGMVGLSYGRPATFIATDTRVAEFCRMTGLGYHDVHTYSDLNLVKELRSPPQDHTGFVRNWRALRDAMAGVLEANGLLSTLAPVAAVASGTAPTAK
jgi:polysaccharide pyruvyl transferase WcaK-like protein